MDDDELYEQAQVIWSAVEYGHRDRAILAMKRLTEAVIRDAAEMVMETQKQAIIDQLSDSHMAGYKSGIQQGLKVAQQITGHDLSAAMAIADDIEA